MKETNLSIPWANALLQETLTKYSKKSTREGSCAVCEWMKDIFNIAYCPDAAGRGECPAMEICVPIIRGGLPVLVKFASSDEWKTFVKDVEKLENKS